MPYVHFAYRITDGRAIEIAPRAIGFFGVSRTVSTHCEDDLVTSACTRSDVDERPRLVPRTFCGPLHELPAGAVCGGSHPPCRKNMGMQGK